MIVFGHGMMLFVNSLRVEDKKREGANARKPDCPLSSETWVYRNISFCVLRPACRM